MHSAFSSILFGLGLAAVTVAQNQTIHVGPGGAFIFSPNNINATEGSVITFMFDGHVANHSVSQTTFAAPCSEMEGGFDSGFVFVPQDDTNGPFATWNLTITNASQPIWFYCKQTVPSPHCISGMVGGINVAGSGSFSFAAFQAAAMALGSFPVQSEGGLSGVGAVATAAPSPFVNGVSGFSNPTQAAAPSGAASAASSGVSSSSGASGVSSSNGAASPSPTSGAGRLVVEFGLLCAAMVAGALLI